MSATDSNSTAGRRTTATGLSDALRYRLRMRKSIKLKIRKPELSSTRESNEQGMQSDLENTEPLRIRLEEVKNRGAGLNARWAIFNWSGPAGRCHHCHDHDVLPTLIRVAIILSILLGGSLGKSQAGWPGNQTSENPLDQLTLEQLGNVEVTTASKEPEQVWRTPAAIYVITQNDIRRSGASSIPEVLRLAPGWLRRRLIRAKSQISSEATFG